MRRRQFVTGIATTTLAAAAGVGTGTSGADRARRRSAPGWAATVQDDGLGPMLFASTSGLLAADGTPLTDDSSVAVFAEPTAQVRDRDGDGDAVTYPDDRPIPLVGVDDRDGGGTVVGLGATLVNDGDLVPELSGEDPLADLGNEEFLLNAYDEYVDGDRILWDEGHGQFYTLDRFRNFRAYAEDNGYTLSSTSDLTADLAGAAAIVVTSPSDAFTDAELDTLSTFVDNGGAVFLHDQSDFSNFDETGNLNALAEGLRASFRFLDGEVGDAESNVGIDFLPLTANYNDDFPLFGDRPGIVVDLRRDRAYEVSVVDVADGDTVDVTFDAADVGLETDYEATVRLLGIDSPESASVAPSAERPEEWEGLAYVGGVDPVDELVFDSTASLLDSDGGVLTDDSVVAVAAEPTATNVDADDSGDAVEYPEDTAIPLVCADIRDGGGAVLGLGAPLVDGEFDVTADNEEFLLNAYDALTDGDRILWDEGHGQFYTLDKFERFAGAAGEAGYTLSATSDLAGELDGAAGVVVTSPSESFSSSELDALSNFVDDGGALFLHDQSDFRDFDATANLNALAGALELPFRFNDDQVEDPESNAGDPFVPVTGNFDDSYPFFGDRAGIDDSPDARTTEYLTTWADRATDFATDRLADATVRLSFDENEPLRDPTRLLAYVEYDGDGDGTPDTLYNREVIEEGYARVYASGLSRYEEFWDAERAAREAGRGLWAESDVSAAPLYRDRPVEDLFFPAAARLDTAGGGAPDGDRVVAAAEPEATPSSAPLFAVDPGSNVAVTGSPLIDESYERLEGYSVDTAEFENFTFLTTAVESLTDRDGGPVLIDGGHGQFGADYALSAEDAAYYQRHLEGRGINLEGINDLTREDRLSEARALIVTTPAEALSSAERNAVRSFADAGGAVVLMGSAEAPAAALSNLDELAATLGTDLRVAGEAVTDPINNVGGDPSVPATTAVDVLALLAGVYDDGDGDLEPRELLDVIADYNADGGAPSARDVLDLIADLNGSGRWPGPR